MKAQDRRNDRSASCFIVASPDEGARLARAFTERGVECLRAEGVLGPGAVTEEVLKHLASVDFVVASFRDGATPGSSFELGVAHALHKPILLFTAGRDPSFRDLRGMYVVKAASEALADAGPDIDRFLRNAAASRPIEASEVRGVAGDFTWARRRMQALRDERPADRAASFERLVAEVFERSGGQVVEAKAGDDRGADLVVWQNDVAFEIGGPIIVECKLYGAAGNADGDAERAVEHLEALVRRSDARLALLIFGHDGPGAPPRVAESPRVLGFDVEAFIESVERGTFTDEVIRRRRRAASSREAVGVPG